MLEAKVFLIQLDDLRLQNDALTDWLDSEERARWARYGREILRRRYLAAHAALRLILGRVLGRHPADIIFRRNEWGRPQTQDGPAFNLSHAGPHALIAVGRDRPIGVDIETPDRRLSPEVFDAVASIAERREAAALGVEPDDRLRLWVRKEAILKAFGLGLSFAPKALTVGVGNADSTRWRTVAVTDAGMLREFALIDLALPFHLCGALAIGGAVNCLPRVSFQRLLV